MCFLFSLFTGALLGFFPDRLFFLGFLGGLHHKRTADLSSRMSLDEATPIGRVMRYSVQKYDGQLLCVAPHGEAMYEIGNYLGGGAFS